MASRSKSMEGSDVDAGLCSLEWPEPGQRLDGRYELVAWVGEGSFGAVWEALDLRVGFKVAIKLVKNGASADRFAQEVKLLAKLQHPGVVTLRDQWEPSSPDARPFFVMDYCESNLKKWIAEATSAGGSDLEGIRAIFFEVCRTVSFVHERGTLHRDLKPSNVLLLRDGDHFIPKLADFGEAGSAPDFDRTATGGLGTACYQSPEQGLGRAPGPASDVFALAVILYEMLTGQPMPDPVRPWWKVVAGASISPASEDAPAPALAALRSTLSTRLPEAALHVLAHALSLDPDRRPSAFELGADFERSIREGVATAGRQRSRTRYIFERMVTAPAELSLLLVWSNFQVALWELLWLMGPTRELGVAWYRALRSAPSRR